MDSSLIRVLENSGFTKKESRVYLALLELGQGDVTDIAQISELKRPIIYVILEGLIKRGYVTQLPNKRVKTYQAIDPVLILSELQTSLRHFSEMLPILQTLSSKGKRRPKIEYHETKKGIWKIWQDMFNIEEVLTITSYSRIDKYYPGALAKWTKGRKKGVYKTTGRHIIPSTDEEKKFGKFFVSAAR